ncbi:zinc dependent phospholipase C family protein [Vibrio mimicus]|uniref:zinc dependent phospholipase C family protein n=1 Tax=Vibrio mimicus TaxID=674 RepID=UPI002F91D093
MPGAFAHITAVNVASANKALQKLNMPQSARKALAQNKRYLELGCVSPDYPYLAIMNSAQNQWADKMHYNDVGKLINALIKQIKAVESEYSAKAFAWLCGFVAHVAADITIHPVVEMKVGPYAQNAKDHRICEMNQDAYIWPTRMQLGDIGFADRVKDNIGSCVDSDDDSQLDPIIRNLWCTAFPWFIQSTPKNASQTLTHGTKVSKRLSMQRKSHIDYSHGLGMWPQDKG